MAKKEFAVFGLGEFGSSIAIALEENGCQVLAVDSNQEKVQEISAYVTHAACANVADQAVVRSLGIHNMDGVIVGIGENLESSIMATICAKECGVPYVLAKANSDIHATVLKRVGADQVIFPEKATGIRLGRNLASGNFLETIELSKKFSMVEIEVPKKWIGKTIRELNLRSKGINIIARKGDLEDLVLIVDPDSVIQGSETFIIIGSNKDLERELL
ncbi:potassium channel family protein [Fusibacillus kribbianus]|uniref:TrkA family potassium uptake protein n=1 Tax=Fusibacillus kribbianus TaxID=3044208 RepID=A0AAP4B9K4_9FIRM|nr:TrkA family potassium uptake protein [Ruminococcus sp. YH-rum2234]MDI9242000.1 TrkA family potassium uptake protein [Ruminococcus sp. YH-rum2234]